MKELLQLAMVTCLTCLTTLPTDAQNPVIYDRYTPDPAPYVHGDTLYLFVDHDEDETLNGYFTMKDWLLYSTVDMVNWTYRGTPLTSATFSAWAKQDNDCWASQCIERNGRHLISTIGSSSKRVLVSRCQRLNVLTTIKPTTCREGRQQVHTPAIP